MDDCVECTHCGVLMTSWGAPGGGVRYWQCPFCRRTCSSAYGEVFRSGVARRVARPPAPVPGLPARLPQASAAEVSWALLKARANRWFARLEAEEQPPRPRGAAKVRYQPPALPAPALCRPGKAR